MSEDRRSEKPSTESSPCSLQLERAAAGSNKDSGQTKISKLHFFDKYFKRMDSTDCVLLSQSVSGDQRDPDFLGVAEKTGPRNWQ